MAAAAATEATAEQPVSAQVVGNAFVQQYYHILHNSPSLVHRFYQDISVLGRPEEDGSMSITTTMQAINEKIVSLNYGDVKADIKSVDAQESLNGGVHVLVAGYITGKENTVQNFAQTFFLAPQDKGFFVLNDMFRYVNNVDANPPLVNGGDAPIADEQTLPIPAPVAENDVTEQSTPSPPAEEAAPEVQDPPKSEEVGNVEEVPVAKVDEVEDESERVAESSAKVEEVPKRSYASIVMRLKETAATFSPPPPAPQKAAPKKIEQVNTTLNSTSNGPVLNSDSADNGNIQEGEDGYSIYIKGLPMNATEKLLEEVFKKFGAIKKDGIQVRSNRQQGFCFGFVEFEEASSVQKALEASPVAIGGRHAFVEEKRSTNSRGNNRGRFQPGRGSGYRTDGMRGRGRGYGRGGDFNGRSDFGNRGGNRSNGYHHRADNISSNGGGARSTSTAPRVPATA
ncbi:nuclear transport factor 2-like isoform X2 [Andrographis paniculata]|uniref:nuclear transport factor 2-like isoform X2 n=1 Tax=Andrographis paniculata TaxID=175694 RepID=UPI0021E87E26|nr:nuclear transport factor 2-like isoform X2 [Andrographis paniculata]